MQVHQSSHFFYVCFILGARRVQHRCTVAANIHQILFSCPLPFLKWVWCFDGLFSFFFFFLIWEKVFWEFEKKKWPSQDRVWERQKQAIGAFIRLFIFFPSFFLATGRQDCVCQMAIQLTVSLFLTSLLWSITRRTTCRKWKCVHHFQFVYIYMRIVFPPSVWHWVKRKKGEGDDFRGATNTPQRG